MCRSDQNVWVPTLQDSACNLMEEGCEDLLRYAITSGEVQRFAAKIITTLQEIEQDGCYYGEGHTAEHVITDSYQIMAGLLDQLKKEGKESSNYRMG